MNSVMSNLVVDLLQSSNHTLLLATHPARWIQLLNKIENVCGPKLSENSRKNSLSDKTWENVSGKTFER